MATRNYEDIQDGINLFTLSKMNTDFKYLFETINAAKNGDINFLDGFLTTRMIGGKTVNRSKLTDNFLFTRRIDTTEPLESIVNDGTYIITAGNTSEFPKGVDNTLAASMIVEVVNNGWAYQTLFNIQSPQVRYIRLIDVNNKQAGEWRNNAVSFIRRIENAESIDTLHEDGTYIITSGNSGTFPENESPSNTWAMSIDVINKFWVYQTLFQLSDPSNRYIRVIETVSGDIYDWKKFIFSDDAGITPKTKNILLIGNSFSLNATEYIHNICASLGININVGILYRSGESLEAHYNNAQTNEPIYTYYERVSNDGAPSNTTATNISFSEGLEKRNWDIVTFQQRSGFSNDYATYQPYLNDLKTFVETLIGNNVDFGLLQTWAYSSNQNANPEQMYADIVKAYDDAQFESDIKMLLPIGTAIQNARTDDRIKVIDDELTSDGVHLGDLGKYIASVAFFESLYKGEFSANQIQYKPEIVTEYQLYISRLTAMNAILKPKSISIL